MSPVELISQVKRALQEALSPSALQQRKIQLDSVVLTVSTVVSKDGGISFTIPVINATIGGGVSTDHTTTLEITLEPPPPSLFKSVDPGRELRQELVQGLQQTLDLIGQIDDMDDEPKLDFQQSSFELDFGVTAEGKLELVVSGGGKRADTHSVKLVLKRS